MRLADGSQASLKCFHQVNYRRHLRLLNGPVLYLGMNQLPEGGFIVASVIISKAPADLVNQLHGHLEFGLGKRRPVLKSGNLRYRPNFRGVINKVQQKTVAMQAKDGEMLACSKSDLRHCDHSRLTHGCMKKPVGSVAECARPQVISIFKVNGIYVIPVREVKYFDRSQRRERQLVHIFFGKCDEIPRSILVASNDLMLLNLAAAGGTPFFVLYRLQTRSM